MVGRRHRVRGLGDLLGRSAKTATVLVATSLVAVTASHPAHGQAARYLDPIFESVTVTPDIVYGHAVDSSSGEEVDLLLDLYEPEGDDAPQRGVFIFIHGGGFVKGNKASGRPYGIRMARRGYVAASIGYRLSQGQGPQRVAAAVSDARQAVAWLLDNAAAYRLDADHITVGGSSAGAITALHLAYTDFGLQGGGRPADIAAVMDLWGGLYGRIDELGAGEAPLVIIHGTEDTTVPYAEALALRDRAEEVAVPYEFHPIEGAGHAPFDPDQHIAWTARFFYQQLWAPASATATTTPGAATATAGVGAATATPGAGSAAAPSYLPVALQRGRIGPAASR